MKFIFTFFTARYILISAIAIIVASALLLYFYQSASPDPPEDLSESITLGEQVNSNHGQHSAIPQVPVRVRIPRLAVNAPIEHLGLINNYEMDAPKDSEMVGWYKLGSRPGEQGSAVLAGHRTWKNGSKAVFDALHLLEKGDLIHIDDAQGNVVTFMVRESRVYQPEADATQVFTSRDGAHLNLVTCAGDWQELIQSSTERLVVFTDLLY